MPKVKIDYSNTIFYKIYCKDPSVKDLYIGHTTNFVQRKYAHKQGCINPKSVNYNCKVYETIRDNMGWENWTMEIIAFHNCEDLYSAKKQEQHYFEEYKATLNSVEPLPPRKPKKEVIVKPEKEEFYCSSCRVYFNTRKLQEEHNKRPRHLKMIRNETERTPNPITKFECDKCNYKCNKQSDYNKHITTVKHKNITSNHRKPATEYVCDCGKVYNARNSLWYHKKQCNNSNTQPIIDTESESATHQIDANFIAELMKDNKELREMLIEQNKQIIYITKNLANTPLHEISITN
jgi:hypothetical protein